MDAWRQLGTELDCATAEEALKTGLLGDWDVRKAPLYAALPEDEYGVSRTVEVRERVAVVRDNPVSAGRVDHIGIVSPTYPVLQNEEQTDLLNALAEESGSRFSAAGELEGGRKVFVAMTLPGHIRVGESSVTCSIATLKSHDGCKPFTVLVTPLFNDIVLASHPILRIRASSGAGPIIEREARSVLDKTFAYLTDFHRTAEQLANAPMSHAKFEAVVERAYGAEDDAPVADTIRSKKTSQMVELFGDGATAWDGFCALAGWWDWLAPNRAEDSRTARAVKALLDPGFKDRALALMREA